MLFYLIQPIATLSFYLYLEEELGIIHPIQQPHLHTYHQQWKRRVGKGRKNTLACEISSFYRRR